MSEITLRQIREDPDRQDIFGVLSERIRPGGATSSAAVSRAATAFAEGVGSPDEAFFWRFWDDVFDVAAQIPHDHPAQDRVVAFVRELALVPETEHRVWDARVWTDLPLLGAAIRERLGRSAEDRAQVSFHAFVARLLHAGVSPGAETTAIWMLRDALEQDANGGSGSGGPGTADRDLMIAAVYVEHAGATLAQKLALCPEPRLDEAARRLLRGGPLWEGEEGDGNGDKSGLTPDRWAFWGRRFRERAADADAVGPEARDLALHAARLIEVWSRARLST